MSPAPIHTNEKHRGGMNKPLKMILVLGITGLISGSSLVFMYRYATPRIEENQTRELREAIFKIVPAAAEYRLVVRKGEEFFEVYDKNDGLLGYAFIAEGNGYQGKIKLIGGIRKDLETLYGIEILESVETPGLGGEIVKDEFKRQFSGRRFYKSLNCIKGGAAIEKHAPPPRGIIAVTGATISSQSVVNILNEKVKRLRGILRR